MEVPKPRNGVETAPNSNGDSSTSAPARLRLSDLLTKKFDVRSFALTGLFVLAVFYTMYFIRAILLPLVLAVMLSYLLRPIVRAFARARIIPPISAALILLTLLATLGYGLSYLSGPAAAWLEKAPYSMRELQTKLLPLRHPIEKMAQASGEIEKLTAPNDPHAKQAIEVKRHPITDLLILRTPEFVTSTTLLLILLYFLLSYDGVFLNKVIRILPTLSDKKRAVSIASDIEGHVSRYLFTVAVINACLGTAVGITVGLLGLPNPVMWGVMVALLNFIPYLGALTGITCITLGAVLSFPSFSYALIFPAVYLALATLEGNFVTPWVMGRSLTLNPVMILLSLVFWGFMWGIPGIILAVPMLAAFKIFCTHVEGMEAIAEFLS